jgi:hypothetical protein
VDEEALQKSGYAEAYILAHLVSSFVSSSNSASLLLQSTSWFNWPLVHLVLPSLSVHYFLVHLFNNVRLSNAIYFCLIEYNSD